MDAATSRHRAEGVDVIVRFHDIRYLLQLERAVFSLAGQSHRPLRILLVTQRFSLEQQDAVKQALAPMLSWSGEVSLSLQNYQRDTPSDARSALMNLGFAAATGRYIGFLDYDDVLFPEAYHLLTERLRLGGAAIAFARTPVVTAEVYPNFLHALRQSHPFAGRSLADLFRSNFCPLHSFVIDRTRIGEGSLRFEPTLTIEEDYDLLIRLCAEYPSDFALVDTDLGLYFYKNDGSNTFSRDRELEPGVALRNAVAREFVEVRRKMTVLSPVVQKALGLDVPVDGLTVRGWLDRPAPAGDEAAGA